MSEKYWGWEVWSEDGATDLLDYGKADTELEAYKAANGVVRQEASHGTPCVAEVDLYWDDLNPTNLAIKEGLPQMFDERIAEVQAMREGHAINPEVYPNDAESPAHVYGHVEEVLRALREKVLKATDRL